MASTTLKTATFAPMPRARARIANMAKPGERCSVRTLYLKSEKKSFTVQERADEAPG